MKTIFFLLIAAFSLTSVSLFAQQRKDKTAVTYEELYDEPYSINKLFVQFQPFYGELFVTNVNAGFGIEASYYLRDKANFKAQIRKTYSRKFFDFGRDMAHNYIEDMAAKNSSSRFSFSPKVFNYIELGGTYHIKDFEKSSKTIMHLYKNSYKGNKWASRVPLEAEVPCKVRNIYGARIGGITWSSVTDLSRAMERQDLTNQELVTSEGVGLDNTYMDQTLQQEEKLNVFTNVSATGLYIGGSMTWIRNVAVDFDKFEEGIDDLILNAYVDILFSPLLTVDDVVYNDVTYSTAAIKTQNFGFRAGIEGKFNRTLSWAYGGEVGYRPTISGSGFFAVLKISFPVYGTNLDYKVESFGK